MSTRRPPTASRFELQPNSVPRRQIARPDPFGLSLEDRGHVRRLFAQHEKRAALYYASLFGCDRLPRGSKDLV